MFSEPKLQPRDAVAALLLHEDGRYIVQLRDMRADIFYPGHWGCFGGSVESGESPGEALRRELREEIEFEIRDESRFTQFDFDFSHFGLGKVYRVYFEVVVTENEFRRFVLHEGTEFRAFDSRELLSGLRVTPYDAFAIWIHASRSRFARTNQDISPRPSDA